MRKKQNYFHKFHSSKKQPKMQQDFIFFDCESEVFEESDIEQKQQFKLGCSLYWNVKTDSVQKFTFYKSLDFFNWLESFFSPTCRSIICFAHNIQFDFNMINGFDELIQREWELVTIYSKGNVTIYTFKHLWKIDEKKRKHYLTLRFWDTLNYVPVKLKEIGKNVGLEKIEIDLKTCNLEELEIYCMNDVEIIYLYIKYLVEFLETHQLGSLKATMSSLAFSTFRNKFSSNEQIWIHNKERCIKLERKAYRGGITDVFFHNKPVFCVKTDVNSMYPYIMKNSSIPTKLLFYGSCKNANLDFLYKKYKENFGLIAEITFQLPGNKANILFKNEELQKLCFNYGDKLKGTFCSPELKYIEENGTILKIHKLAIYKIEKIFTDYINFFYQFKQQYTLENKLVFREISKRYMTNLYGKWGQYEEMWGKLHLTQKQYETHKIGLEIALLNYQFNSSIYYLGAFDELGELYYINNIIMQKKRLKQNMFDAFVAIAAFITSHARILLMSYREIAGLNECYYCDTDSLFLSERGFNRLKRSNLIDELELGKLKVEGRGIGIFYNPKFFDFYDFKEITKLKRTMKGINQEKAVKTDETQESVTYNIQSWERLKTILKKQHTNIQIINYTDKTLSKRYSKGKVTQKGWTIPNLVET